MSDDKLMSVEAYNEMKKAEFREYQKNMTDHSEWDEMFEKVHSGPNLLEGVKWDRKNQRFYREDEQQKSFAASKKK